MKAIPGLPKGLVSTQSRFKALETARAEADYLGSTSITPIWCGEEGYPEKMRGLTNSPVMLYTAGQAGFNGRPVVSIVGTRHATPYGISFTERLVADLAEAYPETIIVSGLAYGIDIAAHRAALKSGLETVAVVAHGLSTIYPAAHRDVASRMIASGGAVMTEYLHDVAPLRPHFLARNRIIARLASAVVVVESTEKGGALSTVRHAVVAGRPVFALPGRVTDLYSSGCNKLIADGVASLISSADSIVDALGLPRRTKEESASPSSSLTDGLNPEEMSILKAIATEPAADNDYISAVTSLPPHVLMAYLIGLEMRGLISSVAGNRYQLQIPFDINSKP
ncbi:MAG: DNA-processing protein DprA [Muribaculaceae bacterium]|nr:DNA-processing protein DprA [Muribaculaceae bacterium]